MHSKSRMGLSVKVNIKVKFKISQSLRYTHICLSRVTLIKMGTNNPSHKSVVLESCQTKPSLPNWQNSRPSSPWTATVLLLTPSSLIFLLFW